MASLEQPPPPPPPPPPPSPADVNATASSQPPPSHRLRCISLWRRSLRLGVEINPRPPRPSLRPRKVLIHSAWISLVGLFLIRLGTTVTTATEARVFSIAGAAAASLPWLLLFLATAAISLLLEADVCDLTWVFSGSGGGPPPPPQEELRLVSGLGEDDLDNEGAGKRGDEASYEIGSCSTGKGSTSSSLLGEPHLVSGLRDDDELEGSGGGQASLGIGSFSTTGSEASTPSAARGKRRFISGLGDDDRDGDGEGNGRGEASDVTALSPTGSERTTPSVARCEPRLVSGPGEGEDSGGGEASTEIASFTTEREACTASAVPAATMEAAMPASSEAPPV